MAAESREATRFFRAHIRTPNVRPLTYCFRAGDTVRVAGEGDWTLATDEHNGVIVRLEQPERIARVQDATLLRSATAEERYATLISVANRPEDSRARGWAFDDLGLETLNAAKKATRVLVARTNDQRSHLAELEGNITDLSHAVRELRWVTVLSLMFATAALSAVVWRLG